MIRAVLDTNILLAALRSKTPRHSIIRRYRNGGCAMMIANTALTEYEEALAGFVAAANGIAAAETGDLLLFFKAHIGESVQYPGGCTRGKEDATPGPVTSRPPPGKRANEGFGGLSAAAA